MAIYLDGKGLDRFLLFSLALLDDETEGYKNLIIVHRPIKMVEDEKSSIGIKGIAVKHKTNVDNDKIGHTNHRHSRNIMRLRSHTPDRKLCKRRLNMNRA